MEEKQEDERMKELTEALAAAGATVPTYMIDDHMKGDDNLLLKTLGALNIRCLADPKPETIRCRLVDLYGGAFNYEYGYDRDDEIDIVEDPGGEDGAREYIEQSRSLVAVPSNQLQMIRLLKEAGFIEENSNMGVVSALDEVVDTDNAATGGNQSSKVSAPSGAGGGASTNRRALGGGAGKTGQGNSSPKEKKKQQKTESAFSDSYSEVVMKGGISLAVFPSTINRLPLLLLGAAHAVIAAAWYFPERRS